VRIIVAGAGIGGLGVATGLLQAGHDVVALERASQLESVGAGITLFRNAIGALDRLGAGDAVRAKGAAAKRSTILTSSGRELTRLPPDLLEGAVAVHRADLQGALLPDGTDVRLGADVRSIEHTGDGVVARTADGTEERGDLLIGADGLRSLVRASVVTAAPRYGGYTAWRGVSPVRVDAGRMSESWGVGERFGLVDIGSGTYWSATANAPEGETDDPGDRKAQLVRRFSHWHPPIAAVLDATPADAILRNDVYFLDPLPRWSSGRIVLLGDAAHATTPGVGQGAAQALEDAVALADALSDRDKPARDHELSAALNRYESARRPRAELALKLSRRADAAAQLAKPIGCRLRNALTSRVPHSVQRRQLSPLIRHPPT
jgi:2-polyprenyl-6-methoxyphenol hydroxylase-like FAD-dependent oxidoreductase